MIERRQQLRFAFEPRHALGILHEECMQRLDRHRAAQPRVGGPINLAHAARAERRDDLVGPDVSTRRQCHSREAPILLR